MNTRMPLFLLSMLFVCLASAAETTYQPFVLASINETSLAEQTSATIDALAEAGYSLAGQYAPIENANVLVVTSPELLANAQASPKGGYGAGARVSITERDGKTEVAFVNPLYISYAYRMDADMQGVYESLSAALGNIEAFGAEKPLSAKKLGKYHYMMGMPYFDDPMELADFDNHQDAVAAVEHGLAIEGDALTLVYRIDIPGKEQTVFGVGMKATSDAKDEVQIDSAHQMEIVDFEGYSKVAYFPYEILVNGSEVEALHMKFRMAVHFPDLSMAGAHGFTKLIKAPGATKRTLEILVETD